MKLHAIQTGSVRITTRGWSKDEFGVGVLVPAHRSVPAAAGGGCSSATGNWR